MELIDVLSTTHTILSPNCKIPPPRPPAFSPRGMQPVILFPKAQERNVGQVPLKTLPPGIESQPKWVGLGVYNPKHSEPGTSLACKNI